MSVSRPWYPVTKPITPISAETKAEIKRFIENALTAGLPTHMLVAKAKKDFNISKSYTMKMMAEVRDKWVEEEKESRPANKAEQVRRLQYHIQRARDDKNWSAIANFERLLADIQGTKEPIEVAINIDQTVTEATLHVVAQMTPEQIKSMIATQKKLREGQPKVIIESPSTSQEVQTVQTKESK